MGRSDIRTLSPYEKRWMKIFAAGVSKKDIEQYVTSPHRKTILLLLSAWR